MEQALSVFSAIWNRNSAALQGTEGADQDQEFENQYLESCAALFAHTAASGVTTCMLKLSSSDETTTESEELLLFLKACVEVICATPSSVRVLCLFGDGKDKRFEALLSSCLSRNNSPMVMQMSALACSLFNALDDSSCDDEARGLCPSIVRSVLPSALYLLPTKWPVLPLQMSQYVSAEDHAKEEANAALIRLNLWPSLQLIYTALSQPFALSLLHESGSAADLTLAASSTTFAADVAVAARDTLLPCAASLYTSLSEEINYSQNTVEQVEKDEEERSALKVFRSSILDIIRALVFALCGKGGRRGNDIARLVLSPTESVKAILSLCAGALLAPQADIDDQTHQNDCLVCVDLLAAAFKLFKGTIASVPCMVKLGLYPLVGPLSMAPLAALISACMCPPVALLLGFAYSSITLLTPGIPLIVLAMEAAFEGSFNVKSKARPWPCRLFGPRS
jgi:hypothetical protein